MTVMGEKSISSKNFFKLINLLNKIMPQSISWLGKRNMKSKKVKSEQ